MKYLIVLLVVAVVLWLILGRKRTRGDRASAAPPPAPGGSKNDAGVPMIACVHCGVHLPEPDALFDAEGRSFCGEEHRRLFKR